VTLFDFPPTIVRWQADGLFFEGRTFRAVR
jgi:hypothetical protein